MPCFPVTIERGMTSAERQLRERELALMKEEELVAEVEKHLGKLKDITQEQRDSLAIRKQGIKLQRAQIEEDRLAGEEKDELGRERFLLQERLKNAKAVGNLDAEISAMRKISEMRIAEELATRFKDDAVRGAEFERLAREETERKILNLKEKNTKKINRTTEKAGVNIEEDIAAALKDQA